VRGGILPQVPWIVAPAGYTKHSDWPINYGAWYIDQILGILVPNPEVFSKTVLILNCDEAASCQLYSSLGEFVQGGVARTSVPTWPCRHGPEPLAAGSWCGLNPLTLLSQLSQ